MTKKNNVKPIAKKTAKKTAKREPTASYVNNRLSDFLDIMSSNLNAIDARLDKLEQAPALPKDYKINPAPGRKNAVEPSEGTIIAFTKYFGREKPYTYAGIKTNGFWRITGKNRDLSMTWEKLKKFISEGETSDVLIYKGHIDSMLGIVPPTPENFWETLQDEAQT